MIPLTLKISALGPYAGTELIDFRGLNAARAFLITGPTGGGKTTLFDAIQFALFGQTTGGERSAADMRSDLADPDTRTEVDFRFQLGAETYRVTRSPEQDRPRLRGEGTTRDPHKANLWRITGCDLADDDCGEVLATRVNDVTRRVGEMLGLTAEEFRQIVVLPQDRFRELLTAGSAERERILRTLFQTRFYARIQEILNDRARAAGREQQEQRNQITALLQDAELDTADALRARAEARTQDLETARQRAGQRQQEHDAIARRLDDARRISSLFDERDQRAGELQRLSANADRVAQLRGRIERAERAQAVVSTEDALTTAQRRLATAQQDLEAALERRAAARTNADTARAALEQEGAREPTREAARSEVQRLESLLPRIERLQQAEARADQAEKSLADVRASHGRAQQRLVHAGERAATAERAQRSAEDAQARLPGAEAAADAAEQAVIAHDRITELDDALAQDAETIQMLEDQLANTEATRLQLEAELERALDALQTQQAARLAEALAADTPCPVCGSLEHPNPARGETSAAGAPDIPGIRKRLKSAEASERDARDHLTNTRAKQEGRQSERARLADQLGEQADEPRSALEGQRAELAQAAESYRHAARTIEQARQEYLAAVAERDAADAALRQADADWRRAESEKAAADSAAETERRDIPEGLRSHKTLTQRLDQARTGRDKLERALTAARESKDAAEREETAALEAERAAVTHRDGAQSDVDHANEHFHRAIETAGFDGIDAYREARADQPNLEALRREVSDHDQAVATAQHRIDELDNQLIEQERPDVGALETEMTAARTTLEQARAEETRTSERLDNDRRRIERLDALEAQMAATAETLERIGSMARVATGDNNLRTSFERYVMAELLDEILEAATARLSIMSRGRYALYRETRAGDQRQRGGLDIVVHDDHTGKLRPASTLSGGEGFLASLALALGTSDVVQARSGGVRIDALYIDEGFGSLDSETLDQAMRVILDLQRHSDRVVGMISHVSEMRERIPARLEIAGGRQGSRISVRLP